jgi:uncharacterized protein YjbI with pentapeptide repeats
VSQAVPAGAVVETREQVRILLEEGGLRGRVVRDLHYPGLRMQDAILDDARFERVTLQEAIFGRADLGRTFFQRVDLRRARFEDAVLVDAAFEDSDLTEACLEGAHFQRVSFLRGAMANLQAARARLVDVSVVESNLYGLRLDSATIIRCRFHDPRPNTAIEMTRVSLRGAVLIDCDLGGANLYRADLAGALFVRCNLEGATLTASEAAGARLVGCRTLGADLPDALRSQRQETQG